MNARNRAILKGTLVGLLVLTAVGFASVRLRKATNVGEDGARIWFYDESERKLYAVPRDTVPPHAGTGGSGGDGVRAIVVASARAKAASADQRIAYLETYTPALRDLLEGIRAAKAAGKPFASVIPKGESGFFEKNTLVRRESDARWHEAGSPEARKIMNEWRDWRGPDGSLLVLCTP